MFFLLIALLCLSLPVTVAFILLFLLLVTFAFCCLLLCFSAFCEKASIDIEYQVLPVFSAASDVLVSKAAGDLKRDACATPMLLLTNT